MTVEIITSPYEGLTEEERQKQYMHDAAIRHAEKYDSVPLMFDGEKWVQVGEVMPKTGDCHKC